MVGNTGFLEGMKNYLASLDHLKPSQKDRQSLTAACSLFDFVMTKFGEMTQQWQERARVRILRDRRIMHI